MARFAFDKNIDEQAEKGGFILVPAGKYVMRLQECELARIVSPKDGNETEAWKARMLITEGKWEGNEIRDTLFFSPKAQVRIYKFYRAFGAYLGATLGEHIAALDTNGSQDLLIGRTALVEVEHREGEYKGKKTTFANPTFAGYEPLGGSGGTAAPASGPTTTGLSAAATSTAGAATPPVDYGDLPF